MSVSDLSVSQDCPSERLPRDGEPLEARLLGVRRPVAEAEAAAERAQLGVHRLAARGCGRLLGEPRAQRRQRLEGQRQRNW